MVCPRVLTVPCASSLASNLWRSKEHVERSPEFFRHVGFISSYDTNYSAAFKGRLLLTTHDWWPRQNHHSYTTSQSLHHSNITSVAPTTHTVYSHTIPTPCHYLRTIRKSFLCHSSSYNTSIQSPYYLNSIPTPQYQFIHPMPSLYIHIFSMPMSFPYHRTVTIPVLLSTIPIKSPSSSYHPYVIFLQSVHTVSSPPPPHHSHKPPSSHHPHTTHTSSTHPLITHPPSPHPTPSFPYHPDPFPSVQYTPPPNIISCS